MSASAFSISITPPRRKPAQRSKRRTNDSSLSQVEMEVKLILAPFNPIPEINFGQLRLYGKADRNLTIYNPNSTCLQVELVNLEPEDGVTVRECGKDGRWSGRLDTGQTVEMHFCWSPMTDGYLRKTVDFKVTSSFSRMFQVKLTGNCVAATAITNQNKKQVKGSTYKQIRSCKRGIQSKNCTKNINLRRETYCIANKENREPRGFPVVNIFTSSPDEKSFVVSHRPRLSPTSAPHPFLVSSPTTSASLLQLPHSVNVSNLSHITKYEDGGDIELRSGNSWLENVAENPFEKKIGQTTSLKSSDIPFRTNISDDSLEEQNIDYDDSFKLVQADPNTTFDVKLTPLNGGVPSIDSLLYSADSTNADMPKEHVFYISPPNRRTKRRSIKRMSSKLSPSVISPCLHPRRVVSSAISDRRRQFRLSFLTKGKVPQTSSMYSNSKKSKDSRRCSNTFSVKCKRKTIKSSAENIGLTKENVLRSHIDDPFIKQCLYEGEGWMEEQERQLLQWMNSLLTPPIDDESGSTAAAAAGAAAPHQEIELDAASVWLRSGRSRKLHLAPSLDQFTAALYNRPQQLDTLRKAAVALARSPSLSDLFRNIDQLLQRGVIAVRTDRDLHLDQGLKSKILQLLSSYNPLWLRIGLEVICQHKICSTNIDWNVLSNYIRKHLLSNESVVKKLGNQHPAVLQMKKPAFKDYMKKHILRKCLCLIYYLDQAKNSKLIRHNPRLFNITSDYKSSQEILMGLCVDLVVARRDIGKQLKSVGYSLSYRQLCVDEYDPSIRSLHDLRDGVRLCRLLAVLFGLKEDPCRDKLRAPAISRLQKIHNVSLALHLASERCSIEGQIEAKDIVAGHREKILSFLWQIVYKYLSPRYSQAACTIQRWWRRCMPHRECYWSSASIKIQRWWRSLLIRKRFLNIRYATIVIQRAYRTYTERSRFLELRCAAVNVQRAFRFKRWRRIMRNRVAAAVVLQRAYRVRRCRDYFLALRASVVNIQRRFRMLRQRRTYLRLVSATLQIQRWYRCAKSIKLDERRRKEEKSAVVIQQWWRRRTLGAKVRSDFISKKEGSVRVQRWWRRVRERRAEAMRRERAAKQIVRWYRRRRAEKQRAHRAALSIQRWWLTQRRCRLVALTRAVLFVQTRFRFLRMRRAAISVQRSFRRHQRILSNGRRAERREWAAKVVQTWWRRWRERRCFLQSVELPTLPPPSPDTAAALTVQRWWRTMMIRRQYIERKRNEHVSAKNLKEAAQATTATSTLSERYLKAINLLKTSDLYNVLTKALGELERVTRMSGKLCEGVCGEDAVKIVMDLMSRGNRSEPSLDLYQTALSLLLNLARNSITKPLLWEQMDKRNDTLLIVRLMMMTYNQKQSPVFLLACTLLWLLTSDRSIAQEMRDVYSLTGQVRKMLEQIKKKHRCCCSEKSDVAVAVKVNGNNERILVARCHHCRTSISPRIHSDYFPDPPPHTRFFQHPLFAIRSLLRALDS